MVVILETKLDKTEIMPGEPLVMTLVLVNRGSDPVTVTRPGSGGMPLLRIVQTETGAETMAHRPPPPRKRALTVTLEPGKPFHAKLPLEAYHRFTLSGVFMVSAVMEIGTDGLRVESEPARVKVLPLAVGNLDLDSVQTASVNAVGLNTLADPPDVVWARFQIVPGAGFLGVHRVGKAALNARPVMSVPPNTKPAPGSWFAWVDGKIMHFVFQSYPGEPNAPGKFKLADGGATLVAPLHCDSAADPAGVVRGAALAWYDGGMKSVLQRIELETGSKAPQARAAGTLVFDGPRPQWAASGVLSKGARHVLYIRSGPRGSRLEITPWPAEGEASAAPKTLAEWDRPALAAGLTLNLADLFCGAVLRYKGEGPGRELELLGWAVNAKGEYNEHHQSVLPWPGDVPVDRVVVRVREAGTPAVLLRTKTGPWQVWDGFEWLRTVPAPYTETKLPLDLAFHGPQEVVLICADPYQGFTMKRMDGKDIPPVIK